MASTGYERETREAYIGSNKHLTKAAILEVVETIDDRVKQKMEALISI